MNSKQRGTMVLAVVALIFFWSMPSPAQVLKGSISGSLTDPQGAVISGAQVKATLIETGAVFTTQSNSAGLFRLNLLPTGHYKVEISNQGYQGSETDNVIVAAGIDSSLRSVRLSPSAPGTYVPVEAPATATALQGTQAQTTSLSSDTLLTNFSGIQENEGLDRQALFVPGLVNTRSNNFSNINGAPFSANGLRGRNNDELIDGQSNNDNSVTGPYVFLSDPNFVQQYVVTNNNFNPEYGRNSGSVINLITKSGTDAWHGSLYGTLTATPFNAFTNAQKFDAVTKDKPRQNRNDEFSGVTIGGPVLKNKLYIFGGFDDEIVNTSTIYTSGQLTPTPLGLTQLAGCGAAINPTSLTVLNLFGPYAFKEGNPTPLPSQFTGLFSNFNVAPGCTGIQFGQVTRTLPTPTHIFNGIVRTDLQLGSDIITGRYLFNRNTAFNLGDNGAGGWVFNQYNLSQQALVSWTHNFTAHMVNEARLSYGRFNFGDGGNTIGNPLEPQYRNLPDALTSIQINGILGMGPAVNLPQGRVVNTWQAQDNWNYVLGRHQFKAGANYTYQRSPNFFAPFYNGQVRFSSFVGFFANTPSQITLAANNPEIDFREHNVFLYGGDDWKISQNLTLNLGLTWSYFSQPVNLFHDITSHREDGPSTAFWNPALPLSVRTTPSISTPLSNFGPSVGFAYSPQWGGFLTGNGKTVFRGGYRLLYDPAFYNIYLNVANSAPNYFQQALTGAAAASHPLPANPLGSTVRSQILPFLSLGTLDPRLNLQTTVDPNLKPDRVHTWTFGLEREITRNSVFEARYVGNHGTHLLQSINANPFIADLKTDFPIFVPDNLTPCPAASAFNPIAVGRTNCNEGVVRSRNNTGFSYYNGLQLEFRTNNLFKQLTMRTGYTWSKTLDNTSEIFSTNGAGNTVTFSQNPVGIGGAEYSTSAFDVPHVFTLAFTEQLPFFKDQHGAIGHLLGGWALSGNYIAASGQPYAPFQGFPWALGTSAGNFYDSAFAGGFQGDIARPFYGNRRAPADKVGIYAADFCQGLFGITPANNPLLPGACNTAITNPNQILSVNALNATSPAGTILSGQGVAPGQTPVTVTPDQVRFIINGGTAQQFSGTPFGNVPRGALRDAPQNILNLTLSKDTRITERVSVRFHLTALNALNHFNFSNVDALMEDAGVTPIATGQNFGAGFAHPEFSNATGRTIYFGAKLMF